MLNPSARNQKMLPVIEYRKTDRDVPDPTTEPGRPGFVLRTSENHIAPKKSTTRVHLNIRIQVPSGHVGVIVDAMPEVGGRPNDLCTHVDVVGPADTSEVVLLTTNTGDRSRIIAAGVPVARLLLLENSVAQPRLINDDTPVLELMADCVPAEMRDTYTRR